MTIKKYTHYIYPVLFGLFIMFLSIYFYKNIIEVTQKIDVEEIFFGYATTILGFGLATYGIFLSFIPNLRKPITTSDTLRSINSYYFAFLVTMIVQILIASIFIFLKNQIIVSVLSFLFGFSVIMIFYIVRGIKALYGLISSS